MPAMRYGHTLRGFRQNEGTPFSCFRHDKPHPQFAIRKVRFQRAHGQEMCSAMTEVQLPNLHSRWPKLQSGLRTIRAVEKNDLGNLEAYFQDNEIAKNLTILKKVIADGIHITEVHFLNVLLPWLADMALQVEVLFKEVNYKLPRLYKGCEMEVTLTRKQVCCLLALAFFGAFAPFPDGYNHFTLSGLLSSAYVPHAMSPFMSSQCNKLVCLLVYFDRIRMAEEERNEELLSRNVSIGRRHVQLADPSKVWGDCDSQLTQFQVLQAGLIEDAHGCLQVDFANSHIGGGVLSLGNVQEEIRFVISPECLISMLLCEEMDHYESILISGADQFSQHSGYGGSFKCIGRSDGKLSVDDRNRSCVSIVAIDAIPFGGYEGESSQYSRAAVIRELNKAYCGFGFAIPGDDVQSGERVPVATGNWGCGAFGGNKQLKTLIQWAAASRVGRPVQYYSFRDKYLAQAQTKLVESLLKHQVTVGQLYHILTSETLHEGNVFGQVIAGILEGSSNTSAKDETSDTS